MERLSWDDRYRRKSSAGSIVSDTAYIGSKLPWWGAVLFGAITFIIFYFIVPSWLESKLAAQSDNKFYPVIEAVFGRRIHWFEWVGIACALIGLFFGFRNYFWMNQAGYQERGVVALLARIFGKDLS